MPDHDFEFVDPVDDCGWRTPREILARLGYEALPPGELTEQQLPGRLWELLYAAAARRFFFHQTDHLSDRELYTLLWTEWLDHATADIAPEAEMNTNLLLSEFPVRGLSSEEIFLRYFANEQDRHLWRSGEPDMAFPPHEQPPFDRDRFLPAAPIPLEAHLGELPGVDELDEDHDEDPDESDPLGLAAVDREIAAAKNQAVASTEATEEMLRASEPEHWAPPAQQLAAKNIPLLPPVEITDDALTPVLWELLHNLSLQGFYILHTDHLTDRELYAELWERGLRDPACLPGRNPRGGWYHDFLGSWGPNDRDVWLRFYASDEKRAQHAREFPNERIPSKEKPGSNRDWRLPKGPF
jgi:hypothetical protein